MTHADVTLEKNVPYTFNWVKFKLIGSLWTRLFGYPIFVRAHNVILLSQNEELFFVIFILTTIVMIFEA